MYLDIKDKKEVVPIEFVIKEIIKLSEQENEWLLTSNEDHEHNFELGFKEESFILKKITKQPNNLVTNEEVLIEMINELLKLEYEKRQEGFDDSDEGGESEVQPYDPKRISIRNERWGISHVFEMIDKYDYIDLNPDFQRNFVWDRKRRSQLIESLMLRIPVPAFYLAETKEGRFQVVDGLQRLTTIRDFMKNEFYLKGLEYLTEQEGRYFQNDGKKKGIDGGFIMTINLTQINVNIIEAKSPSKVKFDVFRRVNTGGKPLNNQEIRNCLATSKTRKLINDLAHSEEFKQATGGSVRTTRMQAQELCLRFIGFHENLINKKDNWSYKGNMTEYLDTSVELLNKNDNLDFEKIKKAFNNAMKNAYHLFGEYTFRKCLPNDLKEGARRQLINKSLFTTWSVLLSQFENKKIIGMAKPNSFAEILAKRLNENENFLTSVSYKTNDRQYLNLAFKETNKLIKENL